MNNNDVDVTAFRGVVSGECRPDPYGRDETVRRLEAASNAQEWRDVCDDVKRANGGGYPEWWYGAVLVTGLADRMAIKFGQRPGITVIGIR